MNNKCSGRLTHCFGNCERKPSVEINGKHYCWQHNPERLEKLAKEKWEQRKLEIKRIEDDQDRKIERRKLEEESGINKLSNDDLNLIIYFGGIESILKFQKF